MKRVAVAPVPSRGNVATGAPTFDPQVLLGDRRSGGALPGHRDLPDVIARIAIVTLFTLMAVRIGADFLETGRLTGLLLLASETLVVVFTVFRRAP